MPRLCTPIGNSSQTPEKRSLVAAITERITIGDTDIDIQLRRLMPSA